MMGGDGTDIGKVSTVAVPVLGRFNGRQRFGAGQVLLLFNLIQSLEPLPVLGERDRGHK